jgi:hypothetical protein
LYLENLVARKIVLASKTIRPPAILTQQEFDGQSRRNWRLAPVFRLSKKFGSIVYGGKNAENWENQNL